VRARVALTGDYLAPAQSVLEQMGLAAVLQTMRPFGCKQAMCAILPAWSMGKTWFRR
jgi:hypothetical protein